MRRVLQGAALLLTGVLLCSALPAQEKKTDATDKTDKTDKGEPAKTDTKKAKEKKEKFEWGQKFDGKLTKLEGSTKNFTVQVTSMIPDPQKVQDNLNHYNQRIAEIRGDKNLQSQRKRLYDLQVDMAKRQANSYKKVTKDVDLQGDDKMKVRIAQPPTEYDDKGNAKKLTKAELKALKGPDPNLPGYSAEYEQLKTGQVVTVYLPKQKQQTKTKTTTKTEDADEAPERPKAVMILIVSEPPPQP
jgi:hypothetical protein